MIGTVGIHQPEFLPWPGFVHKVAASDVFVLLDTVQFRKNYFQNRNRIRTATGSAWLTVPLRRFSSTDRILDVRVCRDRPFHARMDNLVSEAYRRAPFFEATWPPLREVLASGEDLLRDLNVAVIRRMLDLAGVDTPLVLASELRLPPVTGGTEVNLAVCRRLGARRYLSGRFGRDYLDRRRFDDAGIEVLFQDFVFPEYVQQFEPFLPGMSALDMLMNLGPRTLDVLMSAQPEEQRVP